MLLPAVFSATLIAAFALFLSLHIREETACALHTRKTRRRYQLLGVTFEICNYRCPAARPTDGSQYAVERSYWLYAGKNFRRGFGRVRNWASLLYIDFKIHQPIALTPNMPHDADLTVESGKMAVPFGYLILRHPEFVGLTVLNRNKVPAEIHFKFSGHIFDRTLGTAVSFLEQEVAFLLKPGESQYRTVTATALSVRRSARSMEKTDRIPQEWFYVEHVELDSHPQRKTRWQRLTGRPEWNINLKEQK